MIVQRINEHKFIDAFRTWDTYKNNFSYEGLKALYEELEQVERDCNRRERILGTRHDAH